jgi:uncharacterized membrane protein YbhN (UPF0104 family)
LVTAGLILALAVRFDLGQAAELISHANLPLIAATILVFLIANFVVGWRWQLILSAEAPSPGLTTLLKIVFVGLFFNQVLPTGVGGDAVRAWRCGRAGIALGAAIRSILLDRACGYLVLVVLYAVGLPSLLHILPDARERSAVLVVLTVGLLGLLALVSLDRLPRPILRLRLIAPFAELSRAGRRLFTNPRQCSTVLGLSVITIALTVLGFKFVGDAIGSRLSLGSWMIIVPPVTLIQLVPVSLAGWGVREAALVVALGSFGVPAEAALAISILVGLCMIVVGLPGGLIWLADWDIAPSPGPKRLIPAVSTSGEAAAASRLKSSVSERCKGKEGEAHLHRHTDAPHLVDEKNVVASQDAQHTQSHCSYKYPPSPCL